MAHRGPGNPHSFTILSTLIPNEQTISGLRPIPRGALPSVPNPARASRSSPAPTGGGGSHGDIRWNAAPGGGADAGFPKDREESASENQLETGSSPGSPRAVGRGGYRHGGGADGEGASPLPCLCLVSSASRLNSYRLPYACNPLPARPFGAPPPPPEGGGGQWRYPVEIRAWVCENVRRM